MRIRMAALATLATAQRRREMADLRALITTHLRGVARRIAVHAVPRIQHMLRPFLPERHGGLEHGLRGVHVETAGAGVEGRAARGAGVDGEAFRGAVRGGLARLAGAAVLLVLRHVGGEDARGPGVCVDGRERVRGVEAGPPLRGWWWW